MAKDLDDKVTYIQEKIEEVSDMVYKIDKEVALQKAAFDDHLDQDEKMYEEFKRMNDILQVNTESLKEHMHRTEVAEKQLEILSDLVYKIDNRLSPIEKEKLQEDAVKHYRNQKIVEIAKILGLITAVIGVITAIKSF